MPEDRPQSVASSGTGGAVRRWIGVLTCPRRTLHDVAARPTWVVPLIILTIFMVAGVHYWTPVSVERAKQQILASPDIPETQKGEIISEIDSTYYGPYAVIVRRTLVPLATVLVMYTFVAAAHLLSLNVIYGGRATYKKTLSIVAWSAAVVMVFETVINNALRIATGNFRADLSLNMLGLAERGGLLYWLFHMICAPIIWWGVLLAVGLAAAGGMRERRALASTITVFAVWWVLFLVLTQIVHFDLWSWWRSVV